MAWEASFTEDEKKKGDDFELELRTDQAKMSAFLQEIHSGFEEADADSNGLLSKSEFKSFVSIMNNNGVARGLKHRDTTDEFIDMVYPCFDGFNQSNEGCSKEEIMAVLNIINMAKEQAASQ